jgi:excisionase family DNA binding protein
MSQVGDWLTVSEAAELSGYHENHIRRIVRAGHVQAQKWGNAWMVSKNSLLEYQEQISAQGGKRGPKSV